MLNNKEKLDTIIAENEKYFNILIMLPKIITIILGISCFILGCVFSGIFDEGYFIAIFWFGGAIYCLINYYILKLAMSFMILHICYMKKQTEALKEVKE